MLEEVVIIYKGQATYIAAFEEQRAPVKGMPYLSGHDAKGTFKIRCTPFRV